MMETIEGLGPDEDEEARIATVAYKDIAVTAAPLKTHFAAKPEPRSSPRAGNVASWLQLSWLHNLARALKPLTHPPC